MSDSAHSKPNLVARIQPHMAHVPGPDGNRREIDLGQVAAGEASAPTDLSRLCTAHEPWMRALVSARIPAHLRARFDGEDVVQSAFLSLCERVEAGLLPVEDNIKGYLGRAVRNGLCDEVRHHTRRRRSAQAEREVTYDVLDMQVCPHDQPHETFEKAELRALLLTALAGLSEIDRRLIQLKHVEQRPWAEVGRVLGLPETTARRKGLEAFERLMRLVEG